MPLGFIHPASSPTHSALAAIWITPTQLSVPSQATILAPKLTTGLATLSRKVVPIIGSCRTLGGQVGANKVFQDGKWPMDLVLLVLTLTPHGLSSLEDPNS